MPTAKSIIIPTLIKIIFILKTFICFNLRQIQNWEARKNTTHIIYDIAVYILCESATIHGSTSFLRVKLSQWMNRVTTLIWSSPVYMTPYMSTHTVYRYKIHFLKLFGGDMAILEKGFGKNIIFMRFCCCFKLSKKVKKTVKQAADTCHHQMRPSG